MTAPTADIAPILRAFVQTLRSATALKAALTGGFHEGPAPKGTNFPWLSYQVHYGTVNYQFDSVTQAPGIQVFVFSRDQVEARNLDTLVQSALHDVAMNVDGQSTLFSRRVLNLSLPHVDEEGLKVYQVGGIQEIWTDRTS